MARTTFRYYAYNEHMGRIRVPADASKTETDASLWAMGHHANNLIREDGPASKPTNITVIFDLNKAEHAQETQTSLFELLAKYFPEETVGKLSEVTYAIEQFYQN